MKNYFIGFLVVCLMVLGSFFYKVSRTPALKGFPIPPSVIKDSGGEPSLYLFIFFSRNNCHTCMESIQTLNKLPSQFVVTGIVPGGELEDEKDFRSATGATFKLNALSGTYKRFTPFYAPTLFGVTGSGGILFVLPGVPEQDNYLHNFLVEFYSKSIELLIPR
jgi:hypothetical protein